MINSAALPKEAFQQTARTCPKSMGELFSRLPMRPARGTMARADKHEERGLVPPRGHKAHRNGHRQEKQQPVE